MKSLLTLNRRNVTIGYMINRNDIIEGLYLKQITARQGNPAGLVAVVHQVGTQWTGEWFFQLRYLNQPTGPRNRARSSWSLNLREEDLAHFELIGTWLPAEVLLAPSPPSVKLKKESRLPAWMKGKHHPDQLRLFEYE